MPTAEEMALFLDAMDSPSSPSSTRALAMMAAFLDLIPDPRLHRESEMPGCAFRRPLASVAETKGFLERVGELIVNGVPTSERLDLWKVAGVARSELRNASVLAWAIDPAGSHGLRAAVLDEIVSDLRREWERVHAREDDLVFPFPDRNAGSRVRVELNPLADPENRVDIAVDGRDHIVHFELKVDARERSSGGGQVSAYLELARMKAAATGRRRYGVVFLAPRLPKVLSARGPRVLVTTWRDVASSIRRVADVRPPTFETLALSQFADHVSKL